MTLDALADEYVDLFAGNPNSWGKFVLNGKISPEGKHEGSAITVHAPVDRARWILHLTGRSPLGVVPVNPATDCSRWGCLDVDIYPTDHPSIQRTIDKYKLPLVMCRSKSGGAHLFLFLNEWVPSGLVRDRIKEMRGVLGYKRSLEIYPKQKSLGSGDCGNWLNMPYENGPNSVRYALDSTGKALSIEEFPAYARSMSISADQLKALVLHPTTDEALPGGPPCLNKILKERVKAGGRNNTFFNIGLYFIRTGVAPTEVRPHVEKIANEYFETPLPESEVDTLCSSLATTESFYTCLKAPLEHNCNKPACFKCQYGIGRKGASLIEGEIISLTKSAATPVMWDVELEVGTVYVTTEELMSYGLMTVAAANQLTAMLPPRKNEDWKAMIAEPMSRALVVPASEDFSAAAILRDRLLEWLQSPILGSTEEELDMAHPILVSEGFIFRYMDFEEYLKVRKWMGELKRTEILHHFASWGFTQDRWGRKRQRVWIVSKAMVEVMTGGAIAQPKTRERLITEDSI